MFRMFTSRFRIAFSFLDTSAPSRVPFSTSLGCHPLPERGPDLPHPMKAIFSDRRRQCSSHSCFFFDFFFVSPAVLARGPFLGRTASLVSGNSQRENLFTGIPPLVQLELLPVKPRGLPL